MASTDSKIPRQLQPEHMHALNLRATGMKVSDIAKKVGVTRRTVTRWLEAASRFMSSEDNFIRDAELKMERLVPRAMRAVEDSLLPESDPRLRLQAANMVLSTYGILRERKELTLRSVSDEQLVSTVRELIGRGPQEIAGGLMGVEEEESGGADEVFSSDESSG